MMHKESILRVNSPVDQEQNCWKALVEGHSLPSVSMLHFIKFVKVAQLCLTHCDPMDYTVYGILQARILEWVAYPFSSRSSQPRDLTQVSSLQADSLPAEPPGKPKSTGVGSLSLL